MANFNNVRGGRFAKKVGAEFENRFMAYCAHAEFVSCIRIPDGCIKVGAFKLIPKRTPFDYICLYKDNSIFCDTKTSLKNTYPLNDAKIAFQIENFRIVDSHNQASGYLVEFRMKGEYRWFSYKRLKEIIAVRKSLCPDDGLLVGSTFPMSIDFEKIVNDCA